MKYLFILLTLITMQVKGDEFPAYMKDGVINVTLKDGHTYSFSLNEWKVVPRIQEENTVSETTTNESKSETSLYLKSRLHIMGGVGPTGLQSQQLGQQLRIESKYSIVGGLGYDYSLSSKWSLGAAGYTNGTFSLGLGYDF